MTDSKLIDKIRANDEDALRYIYTAYRDHFIYWAVKKFRVDVQDAKDIFQDSVIALHIMLSKKKNQVITISIKNYLFGIGKNLIHQMLRKKIKLENSIENYSDSDDIVKDEESVLRLIEQELNKMSPSCKKILELFYLKGLRMDAIAKAMDLKNDITAKSQKYRCLNQLRKAVFKIHEYHEV